MLYSNLQNTVLSILHSAHQGISGMESRARAIVFWPGMTENIKLTREQCRACNKSAPSQATMPTTTAPVPATPFESIFFGKGSSVSKIKTNGEYYQKSDYRLLRINTFFLIC